MKKINVKTARANKIIIRPRRYSYSTEAARWQVLNPTLSAASTQ